MATTAEAEGVEQVPKVEEKAAEAQSKPCGSTARGGGRHVGP